MPKTIEINPKDEKDDLRVNFYLQKVFPTPTEEEPNPEPVNELRCTVSIQTDGTPPHDFVGTDLNPQEVLTDTDFKDLRKILRKLRNQGLTKLGFT